MSFADRLRAWFRGESKRSAPSPSTDRASRTSTRELAEFVASRPGVEAYLEPRTTLYSTTVLLIAADGEYLRRPIDGPKQAAAFCDKHEIPMYDARKVGYPRRMRDYEAGAPQRSIGLDELPPWPGDTGDGPAPGASASPPDEADEAGAPEAPSAAGADEPPDPAPGDDEAAAPEPERAEPPADRRDDDPPPPGAAGR